MDNTDPNNPVTTYEEFTVDKTSSYDFKTGEDVVGKVLYSTTIDSVEISSPNPSTDQNDPYYGKTVEVDLTLDTSKGNVYKLEPEKVTVTEPGIYIIDGSYILTGTITKVTDSGTGKDGDVEIEFTTADGQSFKAQVPPPDGTNTYKEGDEFSLTLPIKSMDAKAGAKLHTADGRTPVLDEDLSINSAKQEYERIGIPEDGTVEEVTTVSATGYGFNGKEVASTTITTTDGSTLDGLIGQSYTASGTFYPSVTTTSTIYDSLGNAHTVPVLLTKTGENTWSLALQGGGDSVTIEETDGTSTTISLTKSELKFNSSGAYVSGSGSLSLSYSNGAADQEVALNLAALTQYAGSSTAYASGDGNAAGTLKSISIDSNGVITGTYTNGINRQEAQIAIAQFDNASGLTKVGNSLYSVSNNSGDPPNIKTVSDLGCTITPSALEMSNVDMASELTDMIVTQRGYQSNSKIITVSDELLETLINMKR